MFSQLQFEIIESARIAFAQIAANKMRSLLTALGVIIGIVAVTLMGTAINGIDTGFNQSMSLIGDEVFYINKVPWSRSDRDIAYRNRPTIKSVYAERLQALIDANPNSLLSKVAPTTNMLDSVVHGDYQVSSVFITGTTNIYPEVNPIELEQGRFFNDVENRGARNVCVLGYDVAKGLFPNISPLQQFVRIKNQRFQIVGVFVRQGSFLGLFSFDNQVVIPITAFKHSFIHSDNQTDLRVRMKNKEQLEAAKGELQGEMRRVRGLLAGQPDNFAINTQDSFKSTLGVVKAGIAVAGLFITGLALFVGAIGIMNITFVSVKERTREIGTRKALGARRRTILLQFLIEAVSICICGGLVGLIASYSLFLIVSLVFPVFPIQFSVSLVIIGLIMSVLTGVVSGFAPAWSASRLDPVQALRYE